jgi:hypothetical protein
MGQVGAEVVVVAVVDLGGLKDPSGQILVASGIPDSGPRYVRSLRVTNA